MEALTYFKSLSRNERVSLAHRCGTTLGHLSNCFYRCRGKKFSASLAVRLEAETNGRLQVEALCPEEPWHVIRGIKEI